MKRSGLKSGNKFMKQTKIAGGIVTNNKGLIFAVNRNGYSRYLPKGHIDNGEDELTAAKKGNL
ncbi:MAG: hypothetical protein DRP06_04515 [Candidatus Aenigmatarchaeota archaeon]|nr:MAG: hypothetical protein DRP06_04515 [Candidatus Aenigmarchaeota archaeon]